MNFATLRTLLTITASVTLPSAVLAGTWDVTADFNQTNANAGVWTYGTCTVSNNAGWTATSLDVNGYSFNADTYSAATFGGGSWAGAGHAWAKSELGNTEWGNNGEPLAWISLLSSGGGWIFSGPGVYVQPYAIGVNGPNYGVTGDATVIRWTAPETGTFNLAGSVLGLNANGLVDQLIKTATNGTRTVIHSIDGSPLAANTTDAFSGTVSMVAGETLDLIAYQSPVYLRAYGLIDLEISTAAAVPEPAGLALLGLGAVAALRHRRMAKDCK